MLGVNGFLGTRASFMLDFVFLAMFGILPVLAYSVWLVKFRGAYQLHKWIQLGLAVTLALAVTLFEIEMRVYGWRERAERASGEVPSVVFTMLYIHLVFAVSTALVWIYVVAGALRKFPSPPSPGPHSASHKRWGWIAAIDMAATALTGWLFYWLAFVAK